MKEADNLIPDFAKNSVAFLFDTAGHPRCIGQDSATPCYTLEKDQRSTIHGRSNKHACKLTGGAGGCPQSDWQRMPLKRVNAALGQSNAPTSTVELAPSSSRLTTAFGT